MHPDNRLRYRYVRPSPALLKRLAGYEPGPFGKVQHIRRTLHVVDATYNRDGSVHSYKLARICDHPRIDDVPKRGQFLYTRSVRLKHLMATDWGTMAADFHAAGPGWAPY